MQQSRKEQSAVSKFGGNSSRSVTGKYHLLSSAMAAVISYTATNPLERVMLM
jgi:hypothetical protein